MNVYIGETSSACTPITFFHYICYVTYGDDRMPTSVQRSHVEVFSRCMWLSDKPCCRLPLHSISLPSHRAPRPLANTRLYWYKPEMIITHAAHCPAQWSVDSISVQYCCFNEQFTGPCHEWEWCTHYTGAWWELIFIPQHNRGVVTSNWLDWIRGWLRMQFSACSFFKPDLETLCAKSLWYDVDAQLFLHL